MTGPGGLEDDGGDARDRALLAAHVAGDTAAFSALVERHRDRLWAVALRTLGDREEAADAVQDALLSAYRRADTFRGDARVTTWLHRVVVNACLDRVRRAQVRATVPLPEDEGPAHERDPLAERETAIEIEAALSLLPAEQRIAVILVHVEGLPVEEAARVLEIPVGTVKSRCSRGRARLAAGLGHLRNAEAPAAVPSIDSKPSGSTSTGSTPTGSGPTDSRSGGQER